MGRARWMLSVALLLAGCAYKARSMTATAGEAPEPVAVRTAVGCLDVGVDRRADRVIAPVVHFAVENRCDEEVTVDLGWAQVIGRTAEGAELALVPANAERAVMTVAPRAGEEALVAYPAPASIGQLCVDVASIGSRAPAQWRCFGNVVSVAAR